MHKFDPNIHYAVAQLRVLFGRKPVHYKHGAPVIFFAPAGAVKFWVKASIPEFGFFLYYTSTRWSAHIWPIFLECSIQQRKKWFRRFCTLQWTCEYFAGFERATRLTTRNETNLPLGGSFYAARPTQPLLKKCYLFNKKLLSCSCILRTTLFGTCALTVPIDKRRSQFKLLALLRLFELFDFFQVHREKGIPDKACCHCRWNRRSWRGLSRSPARRLGEAPERCVSTRIQQSLTWFERGQD